MRVLIVSQMWPGPADPDLGAYVAQVAHGLEGLGHEVDRAVLDHRGGSKAKYLTLLGRTLRARRPDVAFAHFLFPTGLIALLGARAPVVVMAHGQDVTNAETLAPVRAATKLVVRRAAAVIANSEHLAGRLEAATGVRADAVIDCGVDLEAFAPGVAPAPWPAQVAGPRFLCVGSMVERKNVVALADAFATLGRGSLTFVGDGPQREALEGRAGVHLAGRVAHDAVPGWIAACDVLCQPRCSSPSARPPWRRWRWSAPSWPRARAARASSSRPRRGCWSTRATSARSPRGCGRPPRSPPPNPAARAVAAQHDARRQAERMAEVLERVALPRSRDGLSARS